MPERSQLFLREPKWLGARPGFSVHGPIASWLYESGSLTSRLRRNCPSGFGVRVLRQRWDRPYPGEARVLGLGASRHALVREVVLHCHGHPLVIARSVIPAEALRGAQCRLAHLGDRPLGELLFAYRKLSRLSLELAQVAPANWRSLGALLPQAEGCMWGRRSLYGVASGRVLVCEFFLPPVLALDESAGRPCPVDMADETTLARAEFR